MRLIFAMLLACSILAQTPPASSAAAPAVSCTIGSTLLNDARADKNPDTRKQAVQALNDDVPEVSFAAVKALFALNDPAGRNALVAVLSGETKTASGFLTKQKRDALRMLHTPRTLFTFAMFQASEWLRSPAWARASHRCRGYYPTRAFQAGRRPR